MIHNCMFPSKPSIIVKKFQSLQNSVLIPYPRQSIAVQAVKHDSSKIQYSSLQKVTTFKNWMQMYWLISVTKPFPVIIKCSPKKIKSLVRENAVIKLQLELNAFFGNTRMHSQYFVYDYRDVTYRSHIYLRNIKLGA